jgi:hypothetical protein
MAATLRGGSPCGQTKLSAAKAADFKVWFSGKNTAGIQVRDGLIFCTNLGYF